MMIIKLSILPRQLKAFLSLFSLSVIMTSLIRNDTLEYLRKHYPGILPCVRDDILEFGLPDRGITIFTVIVNSVLLVISVIGNSLMVFLYTKYKTLRTAGNKLVVNLAIANFIMHAKSWVLIVNGIAGGPILGELGMSFLSSITFLKLIIYYLRMHFIWRIWNTICFV